MGNNRILNTAHPRDPEESTEYHHDLVTAKYLYDLIKDFGKSIEKRYLKNGGDNAVSGTLDMSGHRIIYLGDPIDPGDALTKRYLDSRIISLREAIVDERQKSIEPILTRMDFFNKADKIYDNKILLLSYEPASYQTGVHIEFDLLDYHYFLQVDRNLLHPLTSLEKHDLSELFLEVKNHPDVGKYLIFKQSGKYTINFNIFPHGRAHVNNFRIAIGHFVLSDPHESDHDPPSWAKYHITEKSEKTVHVSDGDTMMFAAYDYNYFDDNSRIEIYYNFT